MQIDLSATIRTAPDPSTVARTIATHLRHLGPALVVEWTPAEEWTGAIPRTRAGSYTAWLACPDGILVNEVSGDVWAIARTPEEADDTAPATATIIVIDVRLEAIGNDPDEHEDTLLHTRHPDNRTWWTYNGHRIATAADALQTITDKEC